MGGRVSDIVKFSKSIERGRDYLFVKRKVIVVLNYGIGRGK